MNYNHSGIIAISAVLIVGSIVLVAAVGITTRTIIDGQMSMSEEHSKQALAAATSCMELALSKISDNSAYAGNETITVGTNSCTIAAVVSNGTARTIKTSSTIGGHTRRLSVYIANVTSSPLQVSTWQEVSN